MVVPQGPQDTILEALLLCRFLSAVIMVILYRTLERLFEATHLFCKLMLSSCSSWLFCTGPQDMLLEATFLFCKLLFKSCSSRSHCTGPQVTIFEAMLLCRLLLWNCSQSCCTRPQAMLWMPCFSSAGSFSGTAHGRAARTTGHNLGSPASLQVLLSFSSW